jgi:glycerol-3-phosphate dehydrogenase
MWNKGWRERIWSDLDQTWDLVVIGGGITGAGVLRHAVAAGLKTLLVEAGDFAFGTSSRSSKLVHGGLRYILNKQYKVTRESVREREKLLREAPYLVTKLGFLFANFERYHVSTGMIGQVIALYDLLAPKWDHQRYSMERIIQDWPFLNRDGLLGGYLYYDAAMDDCRVNLRVIREAVRDGGVAINYTKVEGLLMDSGGQVCGVAVRDVASNDGRTAEVKAKAVVNATGPWVDQLRGQIEQKPRLRRLRGSHLILPFEKLPVKSALTFLHPSDKRAMFVIPWEGTTIIGTTDIDHDPALDENHTEPFATGDEIAYILQAADVLFPGVNLKSGDLISTFAGLRPIIRGGADSPSAESRAHAIWEERGLITITGGKYTTFRIMGRQTVERVLAKLGRAPSIRLRRIMNPLPQFQMRNMDAGTLYYLLGRHGIDAPELIASAGAGELEHIANLPNIWAEVRWAARDEGVVHLTDLLLRRVRIGMLLPGGAGNLLDRVRTCAQSELGWDDGRWQKEVEMYLDTWRRYYSPTPG